MPYTWDPVNIGANLTLSNGNLTATHIGVSGASRTRGTSSSILKTYMEAHVDSMPTPFGDTGLGLCNSSQALGALNSLGDAAGNSIGWYDDGSVFVGGSVLTTIQGFVQGDTLSMAANLTAGLAWFRTNAGNWNNDVIGNQNPATNTGGISLSAITGPLFPSFELEDTPYASTANFGATAYAQSVPSGYVNWDGAAAVVLRTAAVLLFV